MLQCAVRINAQFARSMLEILASIQADRNGTTMVLAFSDFGFRVKERRVSPVKNGCRGHLILKEDVKMLTTLSALVASLQ